MVVIIVCLVFIHALPITTLDIIKNNQVRIRGSLLVFLTKTKCDDCHWWNEENRDQSDYPIVILIVLDNVSRTIMEKKSANKMKARSEFSFFLLNLLPVFIFMLPSSSLWLLELASRVSTQKYSWYTKISWKPTIWRENARRKQLSQVPIKTQSRIINVSWICLDSWDKFSCTPCDLSILAFFMLWARALSVVPTLGRGCWWGRLHFFFQKIPFLRLYMHTTYKVTNGTCNKYYYISNDCFNGNSLYGQYKCSGSVLGYCVSRSLIEGTSRKSKQAKRK